MRRSRTIVWVVLAVATAGGAIASLVAASSRASKPPAAPSSSTRVAPAPAPNAVALGPPAPQAIAHDERMAATKAAPKHFARAAGAPGAAGMVVGIDPQTGRLGPPSAAFRAKLPDPALDRSMEGLSVVHRPDGSKWIDLKGRFQDYVVVKITPDGRKVESCVQGPDVKQALQGSAPASAPSAEPCGTAAPPAPAGEER